MSKDKTRKRLPREEISRTLRAYGIKPRKQEIFADTEDYSEEIYIFLENLINHSSISTGAELMEMAEAAMPGYHELFEMYRIVSDDPSVLRVRFPCYQIDELVLEKPESDEASSAIYEKIKKVFVDIHSFYMEHDLEMPTLKALMDCDKPQAISFDQAYVLRLQLYEMNMPAYLRRPIDCRGNPIGH